VGAALSTWVDRSDCEGWALGTGVEDTEPSMLTLRATAGCLALEGALEAGLGAAPASAASGTGRSQIQS
jgi:hypothetical protein